MKIVVTGAAGMIGANLCAGLLNMGHHVIGIDNLWRGNLDNLQYTNVLGHPNFEFSLADLSNVDEWRLHFKNADCVYHLADIVAGIGFVFSNEGWLFKKNMRINTNVVEACREMEVGRYVYVGTACSFPQELQNSSTSKLREDQKFPANPESAYGWSKLMGELEAEYLNKECSTQTVVLSLHNVFGSPCRFSDNTSQVIPALIYRVLTLKPDEPLTVWGDGKQGRAFVHVCDVVDALIASLHTGDGVNSAIQIGPDYCTSIRKVAETIRSIHRSNFEIKFDTSKPTGDIGRCADYQLAHDTFGWVPKISLEQGIEEVYSYIKNKIER